MKRNQSPQVDRLFLREILSLFFFLRSLLMDINNPINCNRHPLKKRAVAAEPITLLVYYFYFMLLFKKLFYFGGDKIYIM